MTMFSQHMRAAKNVKPVADTSSVATENLTTGAQTEGDAVIDQFAEQRARRNQEMGIESLGLDETQSAETQTAETQSGETQTNATQQTDPETGETAEGITADVVIDDTTIVPDNGDDDDVFGDDEDPDDVTIDMELDQLEAEEGQIDQLATEMLMLTESMSHIAQYGMNPAAAGIMQATGMLSGTALESMALEGFQFDSPQGAETQMALEALNDKVDDKKTAWSAKIVHFFKAGGEKMLAAMSAVWNKITGTVKYLTSKAWDGAKSAAATAKAHPVATVSAIVVAIGAVAAAVSFAGGGMPSMGAKANEIATFTKGLGERITKIKFPGAKITASGWNDGAGKLIVKIEKAGEMAKAAPGALAGWTAASVKATNGQLDRAWAAMKTAWGAVAARSLKIASGAGDVAKSAAGHFVDAAADDRASQAKSGLKAISDIAAGGGVRRNVAGYLIGRLGWFAYVTAWGIALFKLCRFVVVGGMRLILKTYNGLKSLVTGGGTPAPAAA